jgi:predicted MPP superfamily phosphohydrolase
VKEKKIFSLAGILSIACLLVFGLFFVFFEKHYSIEDGPSRYELALPPVKKYRVGFVADAHSRVTKEGLVRPESANPMLNFVSEMNGNFHPDFVVDGGDFIDGTKRFGKKSMADYSAFSKIFETIEAPKYQVIGNHELRGMTRENWAGLNGYEKSYYYFDYDKLRVIVFDNTLMPDPDDLSKEKAYREELAWLENLLQNSAGYKKIIFTHYSFVPALKKALSIEIIDEFNNITSKYGVRAVFSGHVEVPYYEKIGGVDYFVIPGFFRSEATGMLWEGSFAEVNIGRRNSLRLFYQKEGTEGYQTLNIPSEEYETAKKEIMEKVNFLAPTD